MANDGPDSSGLPPELSDLLRTLGASSLAFVNERLALAEAEWRLELKRLKRLVWAIGIGLAAAFTGLQLFTVGLSLQLAETTGHPWLILIAIGAVYVAAGLALVWLKSRDLERHQPFAHTRAELEKDRAWMAGER